MYAALHRKRTAGKHATTGQKHARAQAIADAASSRPRLPTSCAPYPAPPPHATAAPLPTPFHHLLPDRPPPRQTAPAGAADRGCRQSEGLAPGCTCPGSQIARRSPRPARRTREGERQGRAQRRALPSSAWGGRRQARQRAVASSTPRGGAACGAPAGARALTILTSWS